MQKTKISKEQMAVVESTKVAVKGLQELQDALFVDTCNLLNVEITEESNDQLDTLFDYIFNEGSCFFSDRFEVVDDGDKVAPTKNDKKSGRSKKQL